tara:strand:+ start:131 stop:1099 length:969 start_codon:yes stop_codon:yes gene_type:complete
MDLVDSKFIGLVSPRLQKFKKIKADLYNFRCPICGDSQKNKGKTRGYLYAVKADMNYRCHNCGSSMTLSNFLKEIDPVLQKQYVFERFKVGKTGRGTVVEEPKFKFEAPKFGPKIDLPRASEVKSAREYLEKRFLDPKKFYYTPAFKRWVNTIVPKFDDVKYDEARIIIPLIYENQVIGFQGRALGPNSVKYITIMIDEEAPKVYGLDNISREHPVYVVEGPFDSNFISNSIALCGSDGDLECLEAYDLIYTYDNEPRNKEIVGRIERCIRDNKRVVIWPNSIKEKDINDMVLAGHDVMNVLESNTYSGLEANLQFNTWKRI